jgi:nucleoside-diphosphate-sugar epimerase
VRPNIHIQDIANVYIHLLKNPNLNGVFNAGFENMSIMDIAERVASKVGAKIEQIESNDPRSYRINSDKLLATGFKPAKNVSNAIEEIIEKYNLGVLRDDDINYNLKWMEKNNFSL